MGNTLVFGQADGGERVLAFIEQTAPRLDHIGQAVDGLQAGQAALSASLAGLQTVSMVTLGFTALTFAVMVAQFAALNRQLTVLQRQIARLNQMFEAAVLADLSAGLALLRLGQGHRQNGDRDNAAHNLREAVAPSLRAMKYFGELLGTELNRPRVNRDELRLLARHLSVAITAFASCQIGLEQDQYAFSQSVAELALLRQAARWTFHDAVARDPAPYLLPAMRGHGVTIDFMSQLYQTGAGRRRA